MCPLQTLVDTAIPGEGAAFMVLSRIEESRPAYCTLDAVATGSFLNPESLHKSEDLLLLGADGRKALGTHYATQAQGARIACYTSLYGSTPASPGFDLVAGALMLKNDLVYSTPGAVNCDFAADVAMEGPLAADRITCLTLAEEDGYGVVQLGRV